MIDLKDLDELESLANAAQPGPWRCEYLPSLDSWETNCYRVGTIALRVATLDATQGEAATYIAAMSPDVAIELIGWIRACERELASLRAERARNRPLSSQATR